MATTLDRVGRPARARSGLRTIARLPREVLVGLAILAVVAIAAIVIPEVWPYGPEQVTPDAALKGPSLQHWFGGDNLGRDVFVRVADGYRISLTVAIGSVLLALVVGVPLGLAAGYAKGLTDGVIMRPLDVVMSFPAILLAIVITAILGTGTLVTTVAIGIVYVPVIARVTRASVLVVERELFVEAARARGASHLRVSVRHVLPNSAGPVIVQASLLMGIAILLEAALSFVGLGVRPPTPSLGLMLADGRDFIGVAPWVMVAPGLAIMLLVLAFNFIGDGLRSSLDPRGRAGVR